MWERFGANEVVEEATRPAATGSFAAAVALSKPTEGAIQPAVAVNAEGDTAVTWVHLGASNVIQARVQPAGGKFSEPANLSSEGANAEHPRVALDGRGDPTVVWARNFIVEYATGTPAGVFSPTQGLAFEAWYPSIAEDTAGDTVVGYATVLSLEAGAAFRPAGGAFGADQEVSAAGQPVISGAGVFNVAMSADGDGAFGFVAEADGGGVVPQVSLLDTVGMALEKALIPATATAGAPVSFSVEPRRPGLSEAHGLVGVRRRLDRERGRGDAHLRQPRHLQRVGDGHRGARGLRHPDRHDHRGRSDRRRRPPRSTAATFGSTDRHRRPPRACTAESRVPAPAGRRAPAR